jgi:hypothetical protein
MDLKTVEKKIKSNKYQLKKDLYGDINKLIKNSYIFNKGNDDFIKITEEFEKYFWKITIG